MIIMSTIANLRYLCEILQRKNLYQVSFDQNFLEIYWFIESKAKKYFFQWRQKIINASWVSTTEVFLR